MTVPRQTPFGSAPFLPVWVCRPLHSLALDFLLLLLLKPPRAPCASRPRGCKGGSGHLPPPFWPAGLALEQPQRLWGWPVPWETHLPPPWAGGAGGVRGLSAQPRWRGGASFVPSEELGQVPGPGPAGACAVLGGGGRRGQEEAGRLLFFKADKPKVLSHSSEDIPSSPFSSLFALLWTHSRTFASFLNCGAQNCTQYSR